MVEKVTLSVMVSCLEGMILFDICLCSLPTACVYMCVCVSSSCPSLNQLPHSAGPLIHELNKSLPCAHYVFVRESIVTHRNYTVTS